MLFLIKFVADETISVTLATTVRLAKVWKKNNRHSEEFHSPIHPLTRQSIDLSYVLLHI